MRRALLKTGNDDLRGLHPLKLLVFPSDLPITRHKQQFLVIDPIEHANILPKQRLLALSLNLQDFTLDDRVGLNCRLGRDLCSDKAKCEHQNCEYPFACLYRVRSQAPFDDDDVHIAAI